MLFQWARTSEKSTSIFKQEKGNQYLQITQNEIEHDFIFYINKGNKQKAYVDDFRHACFLMSSLNHQRQTQISARNRAIWCKNRKTEHAVAAPE